MKAKRILALLLALCLIVTAFAACGDSEDAVNKYRKIP